MHATQPSTMILRNAAIRHVRPSQTSQISTTSFARAIQPTSQETQEESLYAQRLHALAERQQRKRQAEQDRKVQRAETARRTNAITKLNKKVQSTIGTVLTRSYEPQQLVTNPPKPEDITLELLLASQTHMGHATSLWNPANQRYIEGIRQGIHIISLEVTAAHLRRACRVVEGVCYHGGLVLFIGTRAGQDRAVTTAAALSKGCHLFERWIPGTITNAEEILITSKQVAVDENDIAIDSPIYRTKLSDYKRLKPDLVVVLNPLENYLALHECSLYNIPTMAIIDTDANPTWVTYPIPANDDSLRSVNLIAGVLGRAGQSGQEKRLEAAKTGKVTWQTNEILKEWAATDEKWMKKYMAEQKDKDKAAEAEARPYSERSQGSDREFDVRDVNRADAWDRTPKVTKADAPLDAKVEQNQAQEIAR